MSPEPAEYLAVAEHRQSVLGASLVSLGLGTAFDQLTGIDFRGVQLHRYQDHTHWIGREDASRLAAAVETARADPAFWAGYLERCAAQAEALLDTARLLAEQASGPAPLSREALASGLDALEQVTRAMAPALAATPAVRSGLEAALTEGLEAEAGGALSVSQTLARLRALGQEPEGMGEMRSCYRIALSIVGDEEAKDLVTNRSPTIALVQVEARFPGLRAHIQRHVEEFGWIRRGSQGPEPATAREVIQRLQLILLRWDAETLRQAAAPRPVEALESVLGFAPSARLAELTAVLHDLIGWRSTRMAVHLQAECLAGAFYDKLGQALGGTRTQVLHATPEELDEALAGGAPLERAALDRRVRDGFGLERTGGQFRVLGAAEAPGAEESAPSGAGAGGLTGQSVSVGRAVGRVRIIFEPGEILGLSYGDVIVTGPSTPDKMGVESAFPRREEPPAGMERVAAVVADEGGLLSHAATISRELGIPCIVGAEAATSTLVDGQVVEVDATRPAGRVIIYEP